MRWLSRIVSAFVIIAVIALVAILIRSRMPATRIGQNFRSFALFRDASRLAKGSPVMIAGVRVGEITELGIEGMFARVELRLRDDTDIPIDAWVTKRAESAFGDSYLEIVPVGGDGGTPTAQRMRCCPEGSLATCGNALDCCHGSRCQLTHVLEGGSTDSVLRAIASTMPKIDRALDGVHDLALEGRTWTSGTLEDTLITADRWVAAGHIDQPIEAADRALERVETATTSAADAVARAKPDVDATLDRYNRGVDKARARIAELETDLHDGFGGAREGMERIDPTVDQLNDVLTAVNKGSGEDFKGRLGRLVNDPALADTIEDATEGARVSVTNYDPFKSWLGFRFEVGVFARSPRAYVTAELRARNDKFYLIEFEKGPLGSVPIDSLVDAAGVPQYSRAQAITDRIRFTAQFGKRFNWLQLRGGIKESTFGFGADVLINRGKLRLSTDLFGSYQATPRLKLGGALEVFRSVYVLAGVDDALNRPGYLPIVTGNTQVPTQFNSVRYGRDYFLGGTLQFTDVDLATLLRVYGALIVGLL